MKSINSNNFDKAKNILWGRVYRIVFFAFLEVGSGFRKAFSSKIINKRNCKIGCGFDLKAGSTISGRSFSCGDNVSIGQGSHIIGNVRVGDNVRIAQNVVVVSDYYGTEGEQSFLNQPSSLGFISIGNDVWIGANSTILKGVVIGDGAIVGAGAVVTKSVSCFDIVCGNPARVVKSRKVDGK